jgi:pimeloyl-ACP methyl ester carboxylesterase
MDGFTEYEGVRIGYRVAGAGAPAIVLMPTWPIVDSGLWKAQAPYLSRHVTTITYDPPGNGRSDRPEDPKAYSDDARVGQLLAVMDAAGVDDAVLVGACLGGWHALVAAARHPDRVRGVVAIAPAAGTGLAGRPGPAPRGRRCGGPAVPRRPAPRSTR